MSQEGPRATTGGVVDDAVRKAVLAQFGLTREDIGSTPDPELSTFVKLARDLTRTDHAAINLMDGDDQISIASTSGGVSSMPRENSVCWHVFFATEGHDSFATADLGHEAETRDLACIANHPGLVGFYAATVLTDDSGRTFGTLCVYSSDPGTPTQAEQALTALRPVRDAVLTRLRDRQVLREIRLQATGDDSTRVARSHFPAERPRAPIDAVIDDAAIHTLFQPIMHLASRSIVGFEALSRGPAGTSLETPGALLAAAKDFGRLGELDWLMRTRALQAAQRSHLHASLSWFINVEPSGLESECPPHLRHVMEGAKTDLRIVLEIVERDVDGYVARLLRAADQARRDAWGVAIDDVGAEAGSLGLLPFLHPDVVKLDMSIVQEPLSDRTVEIASAVRSYAERKGAVILAEGIETEEHALRAMALGAQYGQGFLFGVPGSLPAQVPAPKFPIPIRQRPAELDGATPFDVVTTRIPASRAARDYLAYPLMHLFHQCRRAENGAVLLLRFPSEAEWSRHRETVDSLATRNALTVCFVAGLREKVNEARYQVLDLVPGARLAHESAALVMTPHFAAGFVSRDVNNPGEATDLLDYVFTHDREVVIAAGRAFLEQLDPAVAGAPTAESRAMQEEVPPPRPTPEGSVAAPAFRSTVGRGLRRRFDL